MRNLIIGILVAASACLPAFAHAGDKNAGVNPKALAHYILAVNSDLGGRPIEAINEYESSLRFDDSKPLPHLRLATYYARAGLLEKAVKELKTVLDLEPSNSQAHYLLALVYSSQKKYDLAALEYEHILKTASGNDPDNLEIYTYLAQLYFSQSKFSEAIAQFQSILTIQPENVSALYYQGASYLAIDDRVKAKDRFQKVLVIEPDHDEALNSLAYMYAEDGKNLDEALKMSRKSVASDPSNGAYYDTLGWVLFKKGMNAESLMALQKAEAMIQDPIVYDHMGDVYKAVKEFALARKFWKRSLQIGPNQPAIKAKIESLGDTQALKE